MVKWWWLKMEIGKMDLLWKLYQNSNNSVKMVDYENIRRKVFFNQNKFIQETNILIKKYDSQIIQMRSKQELNKVK
ncbi:hypothetical protein LCGC14_2759870 [marine sediment metagenome]|uniref:Uncharacterized protein n=1 Tax=marine sediment metagenome TaxID=412755 RepID=A0A0F8ZL63_9ZZZZ